MNTENPSFYNSTKIDNEIDKLDQFVKMYHTFMSATTELPEEGLYLLAHIIKKHIVQVIRLIDSTQSGKNFDLMQEAVDEFVYHYVKDYDDIMKEVDKP